MTITTQWRADILEKALEIVESKRKHLREQLQGMGPGQRRMTAAEHKVWFEMHATGWWEVGPPATDPATGMPTVDPMTGQPVPPYQFRDGLDWVRMLLARLPDGSELVEGGHAEIRRYRDTQAKQNREAENGAY